MLPLLQDLKDPSNQGQEEVASATPIATKEKPKRPLSSYNYFFQQQRKKILEQRETRPQGKPRKSHGKIGFAELARTVSAKWKTIDPETRSYFDELAARDKERYTKEMEEWKNEQDALSAKQIIPPMTTQVVAVVSTDQTAAMSPTSTCVSSEMFSLAPLSAHYFNQVVDATPPSTFVPIFPSVGTATTGSSSYYLQQEGEPLSLTAKIQEATPACGGVGGGSSTGKSGNDQLSMNVAELARKLGDESVDLLCDLFR